jgi:hypothetical protein
MARRVWIAVLIGLPLAAMGLWLAGGREVLTKSGKAVDVQVPDELFGTTFVQKQFVPGPILGYYIGLDLVFMTVVLCLAAWTISRWVVRSRKGLAIRP